MTLKTNLLAGVAMTAAEHAQGRYMRAPDGHDGDPAAPAPAPAADPAPAAEVDPFDAAFDAANTEGEPAAPAPAPEAPAAPAAPAPTPEAPAAPAPAAAPAAGEPAPAPAPTPTADDVVKQLLDRMATQPAPAPAAPAAPAAEPQAEMYSAEDQGVLAEYEKNWPDVARAEKLVRRAEYHDLLGFIFGEVSKFVSPLQQQLSGIGNNLHITELKAAVPDYSDNLEAEVSKWVDTQPTYLQTGMKAVMQGGTSEEVADLIGRYRTANGIAPAAPAPAAPAAAAPVAPAAAAPAAPKPAAKTELSSAAKQAAASLAPVGGERSQVPQGEDPQDFDSAFSRYASTTS